MNCPAAPASSSTACARAAAPSACTRAAAATACSGSASARTGPHAGGRWCQRQAENENSAQQRGGEPAFGLAMRFKKGVHRQCPFLSG